MYHVQMLYPHSAGSDGTDVAPVDGQQYMPQLKGYAHDQPSKARRDIYH